MRKKKRDFFSCVCNERVGAREGERASERAYGGLDAEGLEVLLEDVARRVVLVTLDARAAVKVDVVGPAHLGHVRVRKARIVGRRRQFGDLLLGRHSGCGVRGRASDQMRID